MTGTVATPDRRVLAVAPTTTDGAIIRTALSRAAIEVDVCPSFDMFMQELRHGAAVVLMPQETASAANRATLSSVLGAQPPWSDLPVLVLTQPGAESAELDDAVHAFGNVTLLERPLRLRILLSAVRTALRARDLQYQIRGHLAERARTEETLRAADQRKDEFLATLGHELRNPLAPLLAGLQLLQLSGINDAAAARVRGIMERQIRHLVRLVDDLLEVSRITRGVIDVHREPLDLGVVIRSAIDASRPVVDAARHELTVDLPREPITVAGDGVRLTQVFANLITNAAKYTSPGGHIHIHIRQHGPHAVVSVRDDGTGIPPAQLASVFDMFAQVDRSNRQTQGGLGIGLTLVRSLVAMHGGRVEARSDGVGSGSEFVVELPIHAGPAAPDIVEPPQVFPPRRILVVDDNADAGDTLAALLSAFGATVSVVQSGAAALGALDVFHPDTVLLDIGMPEMDGYEVARRIRAAPGHADVLLIALTGWGQASDYRRSRTAGIDHHFVKPPDIDRLRRVLLVGWGTSPEQPR